MHEYPIYYAASSLETLKDYTKDRVVGVITDSNIPIEYINNLKSLINPDYIHTVKAGEQAKSLAVYETCIHALQSHHFTKDAILIAFGGGVVGDLTGFIASTYNRGIDYIHIPTTLLSMVDSSIGCKVALNTALSKNAIGSFHCPKAVFINPDFLHTLPQKEIASGMAEIIKIALIQDINLVETLHQPFHTLPLLDVIKQSITLKKNIVLGDPLELHTRKLLNFGHTIGHALEHYHNYAYTHGHCVAMGIKQMTNNTEYASLIHGLLEMHHLNTPIPYTKDALFPLIKNDKKAHKETLDIILLESLGKGFIKRIKIEEINNFL